MKKWMFGVGIFAAVAGTALYGYWQWTGTPSYSLKKLSEAVGQHDRDEFEKYMDIESVVTHAFDQHMTEQPTSAARNKWEQAGENMARGFLELIKPRLVAVMKQKILSFIETGKTEQEASDAPAAIGSAFENAAQLGFLGVESTAIEGKIAIVTLRMKSAEGVEVRPKIKMRAKGHEWQVVAVANFTEIIKSLQAAPPSNLTTVSIPTLSQHIAKLKSEKDLRGMEVWKLYVKGQDTEFVTSTFERWKNQCEQLSDYSCRLASYMADLDGGNKVGRELLVQGCYSGKDPLACHGLFLRKGIDAIDRAKATTFLSQRCQQSDYIACKYWGFEKDDLGEKKQASAIHAQNCDKGDVDSCEAEGFRKFELADDAGAFQLFERACNQSSGSGCSSLGFVLEKMKRSEEAKNAFLKGCQLDNAIACFYLGNVYFQTNHTEQAIQSWVRSCNLLEGKACAKLALYISDRKGEEADIKNLLVRGCAFGDEGSCKKAKLHRPAWL